MRTSLRRALFLQTAGITTLTIFLMVVTAYFLVRTEIRRLTFEQLRATATAKEDLLENVLSRQRQQISLLANEKEIIGSPIVRRLLGLETLFSVAPDRSINIVKGEIPYTLSKDSVTTILDTKESTLLPVFVQGDLSSYMIISQRKESGSIASHLVGIFDADPILSMALGSPLGVESNLFIGVRDGSDLYMLSLSENRPAPLYIGTFDQAIADQIPLALAIAGKEGEMETEDYAGVPVLAAYRAVPSLGWSIMTTIDHDEAYAPIERLTSTMFAAGFAIIIFAVLLVLSLAHRISSPLVALKNKLGALETKQWNFERTIFTGNELEVLDSAAFDLTERLRDSYQHLEEKVRERTKELAEKNAQNEAIFHSIEYGMLVTDSTGCVTLVNDAATSISKRAASELIGLHFEKAIRILDHELKPVPEDEHPLAVVLQTKEKYLRVPDPGFSLQIDDKKQVPIFLIATPILEDGECIGTVAVFRDVTEDRRIDKLKSEFISLASHQLRTPLSAVRWYVEMLLSGDHGQIDEEGNKSLEAIGVANDRMIRLVNSLLHTANLEMGTFTIHPQQLELGMALEHVAKLFTYELKSKNIHLTTTVPAGLSLHTDEDALRLILQNIVSNAVKYSHDGGDVTVIAKEAPQNTSISIIDRGIGIPSHQHSHVFQKLFRADNAKATDTDGNGLGLYLAKIAADAIGATVTFVSEEGKGTTFTVTLKR